MSTYIGAPGETTQVGAPIDGAPSVITPEKAIDNLATIKTDLGNITTGIANQNVVNAQTKTAAEQAQAMKDQEAIVNSQKQAEIDAKTKTADTLASIKGASDVGSTKTTDQTMNAQPVSNASQTSSQFKALPDTTYYDKAGNSIKFTAEQLKDPAIGMMSSDWSTSPVNTTPSEEALKTYAYIDASGVKRNSDGTEFTPTSPTINNSTQTDAQKIAQQQDDAFAQVNKDIASINNGTFPLTSDEQAQINDLQSTFNRMVDAQKLANRNYEGGITQLGIVSGRSRYAGELESGNIANAVNVGLSKIREIEDKAAKAVRDLKQGFKDNDYKMITDAYNRTQDHLKAKTDAIVALKKEVNDEADRLLKKQKDQAALDTEAGKQFESAIGGMNAYDEKTGQINNAIVDNFANYYKIDKNTARGMVADYYKKEKAPEKKVAEAFENKLLSTGYQTISPADVARMKAAGNQVIEYGGKAFMKPQKITTKTVTVGSGKNSYKLEQTFDQYGKKLSEKRIAGGGSGGSGGGNSTSSTKFTNTQKQKLKAAGLDNASDAEKLKYLYPGKNNKTAESVDKVSTYFKALKGGDNYVSPQDWQAAKTAWIADNGDPAKFDSTFKGWKNPNNLDY